MKRKSGKVIYILTIVMIAFSVFTHHFTVKAASTKDTDVVMETVEDIIDWKKTTNGLKQEEQLFNQEFLTEAGETAGDWYLLGMGRLGYPDDYDAYLAVIKDIVQNSYKEEHQLSKAKSTEWHRISLAILAAGGDPTSLGKDDNDRAINLIADGTYNRGKTRSLGTQGINGWIWGLISLDSLRYVVPEDAHTNRQEIITEILKKQLSDGGFSLNSPTSDPDITAMALQALAPYYNSEETFTYEQHTSHEKVTKTVREVVNEALDTLSELQLEHGDYESMDTSNLESTAQVMVALTSLGINPIEDERFIKKGNTLLDGILSYAQDDGGFVHAETFDGDNPTSKPDESNTMASEQALYALTSLIRFNEGYRNLYDFRKEMEQEVKTQIKTLESSIQSIPDEVTTEDKKVVSSLYESYRNIPVEERCYVSNYDELANAMDELEMDNTSEPLSEYMGQNKTGDGTMVNVFNQDEHHEEDTGLTETDEMLINKVVEHPVSTEYYVDVVRLLDKLEETEEKSYEDEIDALKDKKTSMEEVEAELEDMNKIILRQLYPFDNIRIKDKAIVDEIKARYDVLSEYDQEKVEGYDDVEKAATQIDNLIRARYIMVGVGILILSMSVLLVVRYRKRKSKKWEKS